MKKKKKPFEEFDKKIEEEIEDVMEIDEDSDIPVHERFVKEKKIKKIGKDFYPKEF